jgi:hypothetical protein
VTAGLKRLTAGQSVSLAGERETVQTILSFAEPTGCEAEKTRFNDESRHKSSENSVYLLGRRSLEADDLVAGNLPLRADCRTAQE